MKNDLLTVAEAADQLAVNPAVLHRSIRIGELPHVHTDDGGVRIEAAEVWLYGREHCGHDDLVERRDA